MIGESLGPYKVLEPLGAGGMGEVYLAEDTRLGRKVAIKVLPAEFASDPERLARFEQEARAAAALNHPHIAVVHDVGSETAEDGTTTHFMVQEYLQGQSLRERLDEGALPLDKALDLAIEVGEALIAAHKAGIIHRDLKPDNIFVTGEGHAKVLDFGLAKLMEMSPASGSASMSPTMLGTVAGQIMGTVGYMAPEQINGAELDQRADLFAFGCVLYGMVTGRQAFSGKNVHETLGRILSEEPTPIADLHESAPPELQRIVRKALAKDADRRYQTAGDLNIDLRQLRDDVVAGEVVPIAAPTDAAGAGTGRAQIIARATSSAGLLAAAVVALLLGLALGWGVRGSPSEQPRLDLYLASGGVRPGLGQRLAISSDGSVVAVVDETTLRFRRLGQDAWIDAAETPSSGVVVFSATGRSIYYTDRREVWRVELDGSPPQLVADLGFSPVAGWREGSDELMLSGRVGGDEPRSLLVRVAPDRDEVTEVWSTPIDAEDGLLALFGRINERRYLGVRVRGEAPVSSSIGIVDSESGEVGQWLQGYHAPRIAPDGHILGVDARGRLLSFTISDDGESLASATMQVIDGLWSEVPYAAYDVAANGTLALVAGNIVSGVTDQRLVWYDAAGRIEEVPARGTIFENDTRLSPDGRLVALEAPFEGQMNVWIHDLGRDVTTPLAVDHPGAFPIWSPGGTEIIYHVDETEENQPGIYRAPVNRSAPPVMMLPDPEGEFLLPMDWSPDGSTLLYARSASRIRMAGSDLWTTPVDNGEPAPFIATPANEADGRFSSDGRWIAYNSDYSGRYEVYVRPSAGGGEIPVSSGGGFNPEWHPLQPTLFFQAPRTDGEGDAVYAVDFSDGEASAVREVAPIPARSSFLFIVARDGERFMTAVRGAAQDESSAHLRIVINPDGG